MIAAFIAENRTWSANPSLTELLQTMSKHFWPLLPLMWGNQINSDKYAINLKHNLSSFQENALDQLINTALQKGLDRLSYDEQIIAILCNNYSEDSFPELIPIADRLGMSSNNLITQYMHPSIMHDFKLSSTMLEGIFSNIENSITQSQEPQIRWWAILAPKWDTESNTINRGVQLFQQLITKLPEQPSLFEGTIILFFKLLFSDPTVLQQAPTILTCQVDETSLRYLSLWYFIEALYSTPEPLQFLASFTTHENTKIQQGALILWADLLNNAHDIQGWQPSHLKNLTFNWKLCLSLITHTNPAQRKRGIVLLTYSHFPIKQTQHRETLQGAIAQAQNDDEIAAWAKFLKHVPINKLEKKAWQTLLEALLAAPQSYSPQILTAAMERYAQLEGAAGPEIKNEQALNLPLLRLPKNRKSGK